MSRRRYRSAVCAVALCVASSLTGCASSGRLHVATPATSRLSHFETILVRVSSDLADARKETIQLEATVAKIARETLSYRRVLTERAAPGSSADLTIEARIVGLEKVGVESRARRGMLAGRARMIADVALTDSSTGVVLARFTAEGRSSVVGSTEQAVVRVSEQILAFVAAHFNA
jgi:septal ring factor EnvC (AmiA/AmiB activator)